MNRRLRSIVAGALAGTACALAAPGAHGDGLPVPFDGGDPRRRHRARERLPLQHRRHRTRDHGRQAPRSAPARSSAPLGSSAAGACRSVAYDGSPSGLSADGRMLVLIEPRRALPAQLDDVRGLRRRAARAAPTSSRLDGDFSFDALSPDGRLALPDPLPRRRATRPRTRSALRPRARQAASRSRSSIPNESGEEMAGSPQTRAASPDGRWAYTLYDPAERDHPPFIHALDTERGTAVCIDLDPLASLRRIDRLRLEPSADGSHARRSSTAATPVAERRPRARSRSPSRPPRRRRRPMRAGSRGPWWRSRSRPARSGSRSGSGADSRRGSASRRADRVRARGRALRRGARARERASRAGPGPRGAHTTGASRARDRPSA